MKFFGRLYVKEYLILINHIYYKVNNKYTLKSAKIVVPRFKVSLLGLKQLTKLSSKLSEKIISFQSILKNWKNHLKHRLKTGGSRKKGNKKCRYI